MLGRDVSAVLQNEHQLLTTGRSEPCTFLDITDPSGIAQAFNQFQPEGIIHCAAMTNVDACERDPSEAYRINAHGSSLIASAAARHNAFLVYISTDYLFDGSAGRPYHEYDTPNPINIYGHSKWMGEQAVQTICPKHYIIRTAWLYGHHGRCFPKAIIESAKAGHTLRVVHDRTGSPTFTLDLAQAMARLVQVPAYGIYHLVNSGAASWYRFAKETLTLAGLDAAIEPIPTSEWSSPAHRPPYSALISLRTGWLGLPAMRPWRLALREWANGRGG